MSTDKQTPRSRGRPRLQSDILRNAALTISMPHQVKARLEAAAVAQGRSISQTAESLISDGLELVDAGPSSIDLRSATSAMLRFAAEVVQQHGNPRTSSKARAILLAGWRRIAEASLPVPEQPAERLALTLCRTLESQISRHMETAASRDRMEQTYLLRSTPDPFGREGAPPTSAHMLLISMEMPERRSAAAAAALFARLGEILRDPSAPLAEVAEDCRLGLAPLVEALRRQEAEVASAQSGQTAKSAV